MGRKKGDESDSMAVLRGGAAWNLKESAPRRSIKRG